MVASINNFCETFAHHWERKEKGRVLDYGTLFSKTRNAAKKAPTKFDEQVTGDHFIKNSSLSGGEDPNFPRRHGGGSTIRHRHDVASSLTRKLLKPHTTQ